MKKLHLDDEISVIEHLSELRVRLIISVLILLGLTVLFYIFSSELVIFLKFPLKNLNVTLTFFSMTEAFITRLKLSFISALIVSSPILLYETVAFIAPGLTKKEKGLILSAFLLLLPAFLAGVAIGFFFILPRTLEILILYGKSYMSIALSGEKYLSFIAMFSLISGVSFLVPPSMIIIAKIGLLNSKNIKKLRKFVFLGLFLGDLMVINDITSFIIVALPFILFYEISLLIVKRMEKKKALQEVSYEK